MLRWVHCFPVGSGMAFPNHWSNASGLNLLCLSNATDLTADATWRLHFKLPAVIPSGQLKLIIYCISDGTGDVVLNPAWAIYNMGEVPTPTQTAEGDTTITWAAGDVGEMRRIEVTLDVDTPVDGNEFIFMDVLYKNTGTTLDNLSGYDFYLDWL